MKYTIEDMVRHRFIIDNYYHWTIVGDKDIKVQINKYHNLVEDLKAENITLPDEFVSKLLIDKLLESCINYKQQLKHRHKQMSLSNLVTHIITKDNNKKEYVDARAKALSAKSNMVQDKPIQKRYGHKTDHNKNKN